MSATNHTTHYNLPQFIAADKPSWLTDVNSAMAGIDSAIYAVDSVVGDATAGLVKDVNDAEADIIQLQTDINGVEANLAALNNGTGTITNA